MPAFPATGWPAARTLKRGEFAEVEVLDAGADLNAYAQVENSSGCCAAPSSSDCCSTPALVSIQNTASTAGGAASGASEIDSTDLHRELRNLLSRCDVNEYAASA